MAMAKKRTMRMKKRYNGRSKRGGEYEDFGMRPSFEARPSEEGAFLESVGSSPNKPSFPTEQGLSNGVNKFDECNINAIDNITDSWELKSNYDKCCPPKKGWFGNKKNDSPYCQKLDSNYTLARQENKAEAKELQGAVNYQGYAPPKKKWFGLFGGRRTKRRRSQKKRTARRRRR
jgi:hypothetical protein